MYKDEEQGIQIVLFFALLRHFVALRFSSQQVKQYINFVHRSGSTFFYPNMKKL